MSHHLGVWVSAFLTLAVFSFLYKDNPFYKLAEHIFVGVSSAWVFVTSFHSNILEDMLAKIFPALFHQSARPDYFAVGGGIIGLMILSRLIPGMEWLSRWGIAFVVGFQTGQQLFSALHAFIIQQLKASLLPLKSVKNGLMTIGTFCGLSYFYFSKEHKGWFGGLSRIGTWFLMIAFGAAYGSTVMTRMSILVERLHFLFSAWLGIVR